VRVIDETPNFLYGRLLDGDTLTFAALPEPEDEPEDERSEEFLMALEVARMTDETYRKAFEELGEEDETSDRGQRIERALKDRVREQLGLTPRPHMDRMAPSEYAKAKGFDPSYDLPRSSGDDNPKETHRDKFVQTLLFPLQLERKLSAINNAARISLSEMGVNTLYAAFGYLEWYESEDSDRKMFAPLLLHPIEMKRTLVGHIYRYSIVSVGDESEINLTLKERLLSDFGFVLPDLDEDVTPEIYLAKVEEAMRNMRRWRVRRFVAVGLFPFMRLAMYHDLDPKRWPNDKALHLHKVLVELLVGSEKVEKVHTEANEIDHPDVAGKVPIMITEADSSQFSAIVDVMDGRNLAIKGPPGTGKSQTITNLIGAALAKNLKVLFVAEKMAALEVVKKRLDDAGLGKFCLELHSTKARKKDVLNSLSERLELSVLSAPGEIEAAIKEKERLREQLSGYVQLINRPFGRSGKTLQQLFWGGTLASARAKELALPAALDGVAISGVLDLGPDDIAWRRGTLESLEKMVASFIGTFTAPRSHPWAGITRSDLSPFEQRDLLRDIEEWGAAITLVQNEALRIETEFRIPAPSNAREALCLVEVLNLLPGVTEELATDLLPKLNRRASLSELDQILAQLKASKDVMAALSSWLENPELFLPRPEGVQLLASQCRSFQEQLDSSQLKVGDFPTIAALYRQRSRETENQIVAARRILETAGVNQPPTLQNLRLVLEAARFIQEMPREILALRSPALLEERAHDLLSRADARASELKQKEAKLVERFSFTHDDDPDRLREAAASLRSTGFFGRLFSGSYRKAKQLWYSVRRGHYKLTREKMADDLDELAGFLKAVRAFREDGRLKSLCGSEFEGLQTDFPRFISVTNFVFDVCKRFVGNDVANAQIRHLLLYGDMAQVNLFLNEATGDVASRLRAFTENVKQVEHDSDGESELEVKRRSEHEAGETASRLHNQLKKAGLKDHVTLESLFALSERLGLLASLEGALWGNTSAKSLLGQHFRGIQTDYEHLGRTLELVEKLLAKNLPDAMLDPLLQSNLSEKLDELRELGRLLGTALERERRTRDKAMNAGRIDPLAFLGTSVLGETLFTVSAARIQRALSHRETLSTWIEYGRLRSDVVSLGLESILEAYEVVEAPLQHLRAAFDHVFYRAILRQAYSQYPELKRFSGISQEAVRRRFRELDQKIVQLSRRKLAAELSCVKVSRGIYSERRRELTNLHLIKHELTKKKKHIPMRDLLSRAGTAIQQMKPCWMMSPASVAQFVKPGGAEFDLVMIDEASQMKPEEALGAIGRGGQLVVVGDPQQLPPTSFFDRVGIPEEGDDVSEDHIDTESILDMALSVFHPARELRWHYRSRHESLIAFSNHHFYDDKLVVFPSRSGRHENFGVEYRKVDGLYTPKAGVNVREARVVAEAAVEFMARHASRSLGIVTINQAQREILMEEMDRLFARDSRAEAYRRHWDGTLEAFFVKNLENVQGDERAVIFISTVYGPEQPGGRVAQRFGPINTAGGHRRLNVLFTRAREKTVVFSSMEAADVIPTQSSREGVVIMKHYLEYAKSGRLPTGAPSEREPDSDFEVFVAKRLRKEGLEVVAQVGVAGYFIDIAVKDPNDPNRYLLGIECDGATYHSARSARDRDRLRQEILEDRGWALYRIWSTDWFSDPDRETAKLVHYLHGLVRK
jgi:very-short-patch-repair endonuclease